MAKNAKSQRTRARAPLPLPPTSSFSNHESKESLVYPPRCVHHGRPAWGRRSLWRLREGFQNVASCWRCSCHYLRRCWVRPPSNRSHGTLASILSLLHSLTSAHAGEQACEIVAGQRCLLVHPNESILMLQHIFSIDMHVDGMHRMENTSCRTNWLLSQEELWLSPWVPVIFARARSCLSSCLLWVCTVSTSSAFARIGALLD